MLGSVPGSGAIRVNQTWSLPVRIHKLVGKRGILTDTVRLSPEGFGDPDDAEPDSTWGEGGVSFSEQYRGTV